MGSEGPSVVTVHVTGFKKFHGVSENPTETIVNNLKGFLDKKGLPKGLILGSCSVLETAGEGALEQLYSILESAVIAKGNELPSSGRVIWLHLGVNSGAMRFAVENQAVNEATFRCPDEFGWKPHKVSIVPSDGGITQTREPSLTKSRVDDQDDDARTGPVSIVPSLELLYSPIWPTHERVICLALLGAA